MRRKVISVGLEGFNATINTAYGHWRRAERNRRYGPESMADGMLLQV
jgi:hypothetical protein